MISLKLLKPFFARVNAFGFMSLVSLEDLYIHLAVLVSLGVVAAVLADESVDSGGSLGRDPFFDLLEELVDWHLGRRIRKQFHVRMHIACPPAWVSVWFALVGAAAVGRMPLVERWLRIPSVSSHAWLMLWLLLRGTAAGTMVGFSTAGSSSSLELCLLKVVEMNLIAAVSM